MILLPIASSLKALLLQTFLGSGGRKKMGKEKFYCANSYWFVVLVTWFVGKEIESLSVSKWLKYLLNACSVLGTVQALVSYYEQDSNLLPFCTFHAHTERKMTNE